MQPAPLLLGWRSAPASARCFRSECSGSLERPRFQVVRGGCAYHRGPRRRGSSSNAPSRRTIASRFAHRHWAPGDTRCSRLWSRLSLRRECRLYRPETRRPSPEAASRAAHTSSSRLVRSRIYTARPRSFACPSEPAHQRLSMCRRPLSQRPSGLCAHPTFQPVLSRVDSLLQLRLGDSTRMFRREPRCLVREALRYQQGARSKTGRVIERGEHRDVDWGLNYS